MKLINIYLYSGQLTFSFLFYLFLTKTPLISPIVLKSPFQLIASSCDLSIFSPGRSEVCAFFSSLWRVMCDGRGPHWAAVAVLARACIEPSARHALTHTYK